jgi:hypothetical protein
LTTGAEGLPHQAGPGPHDPAAGLGAGDYGADHFRGHGEADADRAAAARIDRRVDADEAAVEGDQRTAGVARIDRRVGLNEEVEVADAGLGARQGRNDAAGDRLADAEGVADGKHQVAHLGLVGVLEFESRQVLLAGVDAQHREVGALVAQHQLGRELAAVGQHHGDLVGALDHVMVGHHQAAGIDDDPGAERVLGALALPAEVTEAVAEEALEEGIVEQRREGLPLLHHALGVDIDHRRRDPAHHRREGQCDLLAGFGHLRVLRGSRRRGRDGKQKADRQSAPHHGWTWVFRRHSHAPESRDWP